MMTFDRRKIAADFATAVNMDAGESVGHASGRRIVQLLRHGPSGDDDYRHMRKTVGFIRRHRAQEPANLVTSRWRYSLMNWGHDPLK
jgi:Protein of unknown function (DUF3140)